MLQSEALLMLGLLVLNSPVRVPPAPPVPIEAVQPAGPQAAPTSASRVLTLPDAKKLLASSEGPAWQGFQVTAPRDRRSCRDATRFAKKIKAGIRCFALYHKTSVWLKPTALK